MTRKNKKTIFIIVRLTFRGIQLPLRDSILVCFNCWLTYNVCKKEKKKDLSWISRSYISVKIKENKVVPVCVDEVRRHCRETGEIALITVLFFSTSLWNHQEKTKRLIILSYTLYLQSKPILPSRLTRYWLARLPRFFPTKDSSFGCQRTNVAWLLWQILGTAMWKTLWITLKSCSS